jgi:hypothetical protein
MQIIPQEFLDKIQAEKKLHKSVLDIDSKVEDILTSQPPLFFSEYTDHGINHLSTP